MAAIESTIADALVAKISAGVPALKVVNFDRVRLAVDDFRPHEIPAIQLYDVGQSIEHIRGQKEVTWSIALELIMRTSTAGTVDQKALWDLRRDIELVMWDEPNLGIPQVIHLIYTGNLTDLHLLDPYYIARMDFEVKFRDDLTGSC